MIAVRVDHSRYADSRWYTGSGIYRNVWLISSADTHIAQWGVSYEAKDITANRTNIHVATEIVQGNNATKNLTVKATLKDANGKIVGEKTSSERNKDGIFTCQLSISLLICGV